jgi:hypothetical protein
MQRWRDVWLTIRDAKATRAMEWVLVVLALCVLVRTCTTQRTEPQPRTLENYR